MVVIDNFSKIWIYSTSQNSNAQTIKDSFKIILIRSERKPNIIETDDGSEFVNKIFTGFLKKNNIKRYSPYTSLGAVFAERFTRTFRDLPKGPVFERVVANWIDVLPIKTK